MVPAPDRNTGTGIRDFVESVDFPNRCAMPLRMLKACRTLEWLRAGSRRVLGDWESKCA